MRSIHAGVLVLFAALAVLGQSAYERLRATGDLFVTNYNASTYTVIQERFNGQMNAAVPRDKLAGFLDGLHKDLGRLVSIGTPNMIGAGAARFDANFEKGKMDLILALDGEGKIAGLSIRPPAPVKPRNTSRNKTPLDLPFKGDWFVFWGGDTVEQNYHQDAATQRFAFDILKVDASGKTHSGDGKRNEDYFAFGQEIVADADGVVTDVVTGVKDNVPGILNPLMAVGNFVMIRHANGEVSVFCHLKFGSTRVKVGDTVKAGQTIGLCGNTGNSTEPHLHYQVQGSTLFENENSMKVFFRKLILKRDGKTEERTEYSPVKGDIISQ
ncbi:MAG: peptidoglycan DD-metalloendopeptidase family protein [Pyrinomonadaceae bacterium]